MSEEFVTINDLKLRNKTIERLKYIQEDADYYHDELVRLSDALITTALEKPKDCAEEIGFLALVKDLRVLVDTFMEEE